ncbi:MAG TPA: nuclear transport factor 2 family protein [Acidisoma sp.]|jgi:hypothetical protein|nr:nuclear transport factor 2 family protein [Acidisoma sp.]
MSKEQLNKDLVLGLADALNDHDIVRARTFLADELVFVGVFGPPIEGADAFLAAMERLGARQTIQKCLADGDDVVCSYELSLPAKPDIVLFGCGWFELADAKIRSVRVVFDPTPLGKA